MRHLIVLALAVGVAGWAATLASAQVSTTCTKSGITVTSPLNVASGTTATVGFTVAPECGGVQLSLVTYKAPSATYSEQTADQQVLYRSSMQTFSPGSYTLSVDVPSCSDYQLDFVLGAPIEHLGPAGTSNFYSKQGRLIASQMGDSGACTPPPPTCPSQAKVVLENGGVTIAGGFATANFTVAAGCSGVQLSLVSYTAPSGTYSDETASQQVLFDSTTSTFGAGSYTLSVKVPSCFFQVDFVYGTPIEHLGPAGSNNFYSKQGRLIEGLMGGTSSCQSSSTSGGENNGGGQTQTPPPTETTTSPGPTTEVAQQTSPPAPVPLPSITLVKLERVGATGDFTPGPVTAKVGDTIEYRLVVTNTGSTTVSVNLDDTRCTSLTPTGPKGLLAGATLTYTCSHVITAADGASYTNLAVATANNAGPVTVSVQSAVTAAVGSTAANTPTTQAGGVLGTHKTVKHKAVHKKAKVKKVTRKARPAHAVKASAGVTG